MNPTSLELSERVWQRTLPALRRRRVNRRATIAGTASLLLGLLALTLIVHIDTPAEYLWITLDSPAQEREVESSFLAILVVDLSGAHFEKYRPDQLAGEGLDFDLDLALVIATPLREY